MMSTRKFLAIVASLFVLLCVGPVAEAQSEDSKMEVGIQFSALRNGLAYWYDDASGLGGGGRLTFNLNRNLALEAETNYFPGSGYYNVRRWQGQFGAKSGVRFSQVGFFGKLRPGFVRTAYDAPVYCIQAPCPPIREQQTSFSLDVGGVVEFYPAKRTTVRFDVGDMVVHRHIIPIPVIFAAVPNIQLYLPPRQTTHNLQINAGIGFRF